MPRTVAAEKVLGVEVVEHHEGAIRPAVDEQAA